MYGLFWVLFLGIKTVYLSYNTTGKFQRPELLNWAVP